MMTIDDWLKQIYLWQYDNESMESFFYHIIIAYRSADYQNKSFIAKSFPKLAIAMTLWDTSGDNGNDVFRTYEIGHFHAKNEN